MKALQEWRSYFADTEKFIQIFMNHKNLRNFTTTKKLNQWQIWWTELLMNFEFQIHYKKSNENDEVNTLSRWSDYEEVKWVHTEILNKDNRILTKDLTATYKVKNAFLTDDELIQECHNSRVSEHFKIKRIKNLVQRRCNVSNLRN